MSNISLVKESTALLSLRESDFDAYSAFGEVVDNSIQAESTFSKISVEYKISQTRGRSGRSEIITNIVFGDDGIGMDKDTLNRCLQLGYSTRFNDRSGIGRFGVGMTLAAINQCKRVEIFSKEKSGDWYFTYIDLDEIASDPPTMEHIPLPTKKKVPKEYNKLVGRDSGTLVIWSKYDRQPSLASQMIEEMSVWFGRTYRYFIWEDDYSILINGIEIKAVDPLYVETKKTRFPDDPPASLYDPIKIEWTVPTIEKSANAPDESTIMIKMSLLHESFRITKGMGGSKQISDRYIDRNEGISIVRNRREVFYGKIPYFGRESLDVDRWWGCEIAFDAVLDRAFTVKNIKRGAVPVSELKKVIWDSIRPTTNTVREKVREFWSKNELEAKKAKKKGSEDELVTGHEEAEGVAAKTPTDVPSLDKHKTQEQTEKEARSIAEDIAKYDSQVVKDAWAAKFANQPFTIIDEDWKGPDFFETNHLGGKDVIKYNLQHPFFEEVYKIIDQFGGSEDRSAELQHLKELIDLLIISYSKAESKFDRDQSMSAEDFINYLRQNWGQYLKSYLITWKEVTFSDEDIN